METLTLNLTLGGLMSDVRSDIFLVVPYSSFDFGCSDNIRRLRSIVEQYNRYNFGWLFHVFVYVLNLRAELIQHKIKLPWL